MFWMPTFYLIALAIVCGSLLLRTLSNFEHLQELASQLAQEDLRFMGCAQRRANVRNLEQAYEILKSRFPDKEQELRRLKVLFLSHMSGFSELCVHAFFPEFLGSRKQQSHLGDELPNWILSLEEMVP